MKLAISIAFCIAGLSGAWLTSLIYAGEPPRAHSRLRTIGMPSSRTRTRTRR